MSKSQTSTDQAVELDASDAATVLKALANPNRLRIFMLVREALEIDAESPGLRVGEIAEQLDISQSTVSHYLRELEHAGLLTLRRRGKNVHCKAVCGPLREVVDFLVCDNS